MRSFKVILALIVAGATPLILFPKHGVGWVSGEEIVAGLLAWPALIASVILLLVSISDGAFRRPFGTATATFFLAAFLPFSWLSTIVTRSIGKRLYLVEQHRRELWYHYDDILIPHIIAYVQEHPSSVTFPSNDDRAHISGLGGFLQQRVSNIPISADDIIDPWGNPIWVVLDHDSDMQLKFEDQFYGVWTPKGNKLVVALHTKKQYSLSKSDNEQWQLNGGQFKN